MRTRGNTETCTHGTHMHTQGLQTPAQAVWLALPSRTRVHPQGLRQAAARVLTGAGTHVRAHTLTHTHADAQTCLTHTGARKGLPHARKHLGRRAQGGLVHSPSPELQAAPHAQRPAPSAQRLGSYLGSLGGSWDRGALGVGRLAGQARPPSPPGRWVCAGLRLPRQRQLLPLRRQTRRSRRSARGRGRRLRLQRGRGRAGGSRGPLGRGSPGPTLTGTDTRTKAHV